MREKIELRGNDTTNEGVVRRNNKSSSRNIPIKRNRTETSNTSPHFNSTRLLTLL